MKKRNRIEWKCLVCDKLHTSYRDIPHSLNMCECGKSGVDAELEYIRLIGDATILEELD